MGMSVIWATIREHEGYIQIQTQRAKGTSFDIYLPVTEEMPQMTSTSKENITIPGNEKILVVDDMKEQRELAEEILVKLGYQVRTAASGEEAVEISRRDTIDLILLDMVMDPGIDGLETYKRILEFQPKQKAIIVSGYSETERVKQALELGVGAYIKKPYTVEKINSVLREELNSNNSKSAD